MKIFVAKLAYRTTAEDLRAYYEQFGQVDECKVIMDHDTGRSKCYGFVEMPNENEAIAFRTACVMIHDHLAFIDLAEL